MLLIYIYIGGLVGSQTFAWWICGGYCAVKAHEAEPIVRLFVERALVNEG